MCGVFGVFTTPSTFKHKIPASAILKNIALQSENRGRDAAGIAFQNLILNTPVEIVKAPISISQLLPRLHKNRAMLSALPDAQIAIGHCRLATHGSPEESRNNQPLEDNGIIGVHNGIILNQDRLSDQISSVPSALISDSALMMTYLGRELEKTRDATQAVINTFAQINGSASVALLFTEMRTLVLATNHGSLYFLKCSKSGTLCFASEKRILEQVKTKYLPFGTIQQVAADSGHLFRFNDSEGTIETLDFKLPRSTEAHPTRPSATLPTSQKPPQALPRENFRSLEKKFGAAREQILKIKRCSKCILPATIPYIDFDDSGVCNFCRHYSPAPQLGLAALEKAVAPFRGSGPCGDSLIAFSGGRDSSYALHYAVKELGLKPVAYTYEWGMITDIARRNIARMCSTLKVEHIIVSADLKKKRDNIRKNILAWLHRPKLGMIPLFMAGDKHFFWHVHKIKKDLGIKLDIFALNFYENAQFKEDFAGSRYWDPKLLSHHTGPDLGLQSKLILPCYYGKEFLTNWRYLNSSLLDTFTGYLSYYFNTKDYLTFYQYVPWEERKIDHLLTSEYGWETRGPDLSTWRIGDGTTPFYNYIYYVMAGFTENDTLRSNQIREGHLNRETALQLTDRDNQPNWDDLKWYFETVGLDLHDVLNAIHSLPALYANGATDGAT